MSWLTMTLVAVGGWVVASFPLAVLVGAFLARGGGAGSPPAAPPRDLPAAEDVARAA